MPDMTDTANDDAELTIGDLLPEEYLVDTDDTGPFTKVYQAMTEVREKMDAKLEEIDKLRGEINAKFQDMEDKRAEYHELSGQICALEIAYTQLGYRDKR